MLEGDILFYVIYCYLGPFQESRKGNWVECEQERLDRPSRNPMEPQVSIGMFYFKLCSFVASPFINPCEEKISGSDETGCFYIHQ